jgi:AraC-like DNA-binding protein
MQIGCFLHVLIDIVASNSPESPVVLEPAWLVRVCTLLEAELTQDIDLRAIAGAVGIPYETFRKRFKQITGVSPREFRRLLPHAAGSAE